MSTDFRLPDLGEGLPEAELVQWLVAEGDTVTLNQTIAEVETAKAVVELPSPYAGVVSALHAAAGDVVEVGSVLISFDIAGQEAEAPEPEAKPAEVAAEEQNAPEEKAQPNLVGYGAAPRSSGRPQRRARSGARPPVGVDTAVLEAAPHDVIPTHEPIEALRERPRSTPPVRKLAKAARRRPRAGRGERRDRSDHPRRRRVLRGPHRGARTAGACRRNAPRDAGDRTTRIPIRGVRKHTADAMVRSAFTAPHVTTFHTVDVTATSELIASLQRRPRAGGPPIGVMAVAAKAVCLALMRHPSLNSRWDADAAEIVQHHYVNLGIAAATERGLVVPNIRDAEAMTLVELADEIGRLAEVARAGKTAPSQMSGGTFSITNVGVFGVDAGTPILNPGEAGILALGAVRRQPWEYRGEIALRDVMTLSLSFDHRLVDGEQGAKFLRDVADILREPGRAMLLR